MNNLDPKNAPGQEQQDQVNDVAGQTQAAEETKAEAVEDTGGKGDGELVD